MYYIGLISGTSMDAIDAALVDFSGTSSRLIHYLQHPIPAGIQQELISINKNSSIDLISRFDVMLGKLFAEAAVNLMTASNVSTHEIHVIGCHGQTVLHRPEPPYPASLQIGDPNLIAYITGVPVVADFRRMDMAAGGQGAPLAPVFHQYAFQHPKEARVVLNIGGMANITCLPPVNERSEVTGFDTGPGNVLLDAWIAKHLQLEMDRDGRWAASGMAFPELLQHLLEDDYFRLAPPKSTGRDYFNLEWLRSKLETSNHQLKPEDIQATLVDLTAESIARAIRDHAGKARQLIVCGGGAHNPVLMQSLQNRLPDHVIKTTQDFGINTDAVEAVTFAWLAKCRIENIAVSQPSVTGAYSPQVLGAIYITGR